MQPVPRRGCLAAAVYAVPGRRVHGREPEPDALRLVNCGLGRDSFTMLALLEEGRLVVDGELLAPADIDAVVFSDTGAEWRHTYATIPRAIAICKRLGLRWIHLRKPPDELWRANLRAKGSRIRPVWATDRSGTIEERAERGYYHLRLPIIAEFSRFAKIAVTVNASCTANHKVGPIRRMMQDLALERFGVGNVAWSQAVRKGRRPKHRVIIGIAADEAERAIDTGRPIYERPVYPLVDMGIAKEDEHAILARHGLDDINKSGCVMCPYQPIGWFWVLRETEPELWLEVVAYEAAALRDNPRMFVVGGKPLELAVAEWRARNRSATIEAVLAKQYGRCVVSRAQVPLFAMGGRR